MEAFSHSLLIVTMRSWVRGLLWGLAALAPAPLWAQTPSATEAASEARVWLDRVHAAAGKSNFQGTFVVSGAGMVSSARIAHFCDGKHQYERIEPLDGSARQVYRHDDWVHTVWPQTRLIQIEQRDAQAAFPALLQTSNERWSDFYEVSAQGSERVAGHAADVLLLRPKDAYRFGYRLWAEKNSGLLLRADVLGEGGRAVLETSVFSEVTIGIKPQPDSVLGPMKKQEEGYRILRPVMKPTRLEAEGWVLQAAAPGFQQVSCVKRPLEAGVAESGSPQVVQAIFSDGLTYISVFIEPFNSARHLQPMQTARGATHTLARRQDGAWITVVGDVPVATLRAFLEGLSRIKR